MNSIVVLRVHPLGVTICWFPNQSLARILIETVPSPRLLLSPEMVPFHVPLYGMFVLHELVPLVHVMVAVDVPLMLSSTVAKRMVELVVMVLPGAG